MSQFYNEVLNPLSTLICHNSHPRCSYLLHDQTSSIIQPPGHMESQPWKELLLVIDVFSYPHLTWVARVL